jgi:oligoendopeptidase F
MALSAGYDPKPMSYPEARTTLLKALAALGPDYVAQFAWLLNPRNGALEIAGGLNRRLGGFSLGYTGVPVTLYMQGFTGDFSTTSVVIHEGGHAIHRKLMSENDVSPFYATGPKFLTEAYAILNELLLLDEMERSSTTLAEKTYYQEKFLDKLEHEVFVSAEEGSFEQAVYDGVTAGNITGGKDLDSLNAHILDKYELFASEEPELRFGWMERRLLFEDPLYLANYLYAALVACKLYEMDRANPKDFQVRYMALLREGFDAPGAELLRKNMGFTLDRDQLLDGALHLMQDGTARLRQCYDQLPVR